MLSHFVDSEKLFVDSFTSEIVVKRQSIPLALLLLQANYELSYTFGVHSHLSLDKILLYCCSQFG